MGSPISSSPSIQSSDGPVNHHILSIPVPNVELTPPPTALNSVRLDIAQETIKSSGQVNHHILSIPVPNVESTPPPTALNSVRLDIAQETIKSSPRRSSKQYSRSRYSLCKRITIAAFAAIGFMAAGYFLYNPIDQAINHSSPSNDLVIRNNTANPSLSYSASGVAEGFDSSTGENVLSPSNSSSFLSLTGSETGSRSSSSSPSSISLTASSSSTGSNSNTPSSTASTETVVSSTGIQSNVTSQVNILVATMHRYQQPIGTITLEEMRAKFSFTGYTPNSVLAKPRVSLFEEDPALSHTIYALNTPTCPETGQPIDPTLIIRAITNTVTRKYAFGNYGDLDVRGSMPVSAIPSLHGRAIVMTEFEDGAVTPNLIRACGIGYVNSGDTSHTVVWAPMYGNDTTTYYGPMTFKRIPPTGWTGSNPYNTIVTLFENDLNGDPDGKTYAINLYWDRSCYPRPSAIRQSVTTMQLGYFSNTRPNDRELNIDIESLDGYTLVVEESTTGSFKFCAVLKKTWTT